MRPAEPASTRCWGLVAALAAALVLAVAAAGPARGADVISPRFTPDVVAPGSHVRVDHFTARTNCATPSIFLSLRSGLISASSSDLIPVQGTVTYGPGINTSGGVGPRVREVPFFSFVVPDLRPQVYYGYYRCSGGLWDGYFGSIEPLVVMSTLPATDFKAMGDWSPASAAGGLLLLGSFLVVAFEAARRQGRAKPDRLAKVPSRQSRMMGQAR